MKVHVFKEFLVDFTIKKSVYYNLDGNKIPDGIVISSLGNDKEIRILKNSRLHSESRVARKTKIDLTYNISSFEVKTINFPS